MPLPVIVVFDIGKTNKKLLLFDSSYNVVYEEETTVASVADEDDFACEDLPGLVNWIRATSDKILSNKAWLVKAINFSTFGASLVHIDSSGKPLTPLYNYLKPMDPSVSEAFYSKFGDTGMFSLQTGSPAMNMLNSGIQLYWLKQQRPDLAERIYFSLHLPQYFSYLFTGIPQADITSIGCHTGLWDMYQKKYHDWLSWDKLAALLPPAESYDTCTSISYKGQDIIVGIGMHDSSASLLPFTLLSPEPSAILSTGTWNIMMHPSFKGQLVEEDYQQDCLYYLLGKDQPVAAARIFLGNEFDYQLKKLNAFFKKNEHFHLEVKTDYEIIQELTRRYSDELVFVPEVMSGSGPMPLLKGEGIDPGIFDSFEQAYHQLIRDLVSLQKKSMDLLLNKTAVKNIYVTGGFARNTVFMNILKACYPGIQFYTASVNNGSALGAALALHQHWNHQPLPGKIVELVEVNGKL